LLGDIDIISEQIPVLVACNKQDISFAKSHLQLERELTNEIEQIRKVRKATQQ
jgi:signal recognition particle receptor subunit beta